MIAALLAVSFATPFDDADWRDLGTTSSDVGEIALRRAHIDGLGCVEGTLSTDRTVAELYAVTEDMERSIDWGSAPLAHSEILETHDDGYVLFQVFDTPGWTLGADRYWVVRGTRAATDTTATYRWDALDVADYPDAVATAATIQRRAIAVPATFGEWHFQDTDTGSALRYRACADFGGTVPGSVQTWLNTREVPSLLADFVAEAARRSP